MFIDIGRGSVFSGKSCNIRANALIDAWVLLSVAPYYVGVFVMGNNRFPFAQYMASVRSHERMLDNINYGTLLYRVLHDGWPKVALRIKGTRLDPTGKDKGEKILDLYFKYLYSLEM